MAVYIAVRDNSPIVKYATVLNGDWSYPESPFLTWITFEKTRRLKVSSGGPTKNHSLAPFMLRPGKGRRVLDVVRGRVIFAQGDHADSVFYLVKGTVKAIIASSTGKEAIVNVFTDEQFFGYSSLTKSRLPRRYTAIASSTSKIVRVQTSAMFDLLLSREKVLWCFIECVTAFNETLIDNLGSNLLLPAGQRLARVLLQLARLQDQSRTPYLPPLSQQELGEMIGASRQHVNSELQRLRRLGDIQYSAGLRNLQVMASLTKRAQK